MILEQLNIEAREGFDINNLPFGVFSNGTAHKAIGVAIDININIKIGELWKKLTL